MNNKPPNINIFSNVFRSPLKPIGLVATILIFAGIATAAWTYTTPPLFDCVANGTCYFGNMKLNETTLIAQFFQGDASNLTSVPAAQLTGTAPLAAIPATLTGKDADTVDGYHLNQGVRNIDSPAFVTVNANVSAGNMTADKIIINNTNNSKRYVPSLKLYPYVNETGGTLGYVQIAFYPEGNFTRGTLPGYTLEGLEGSGADVLFLAHKDKYNDPDHQHFSIYTTDENDVLQKRMNIPYKETVAQWTWDNSNLLIRQDTNNTYGYISTTRSGIATQGQVKLRSNRSNVGKGFLLETEDASGTYTQRMTVSAYQDPAIIDLNSTRLNNTRLPIVRPSYPGDGSVYWNGTSLYIHNGTGWRIIDSRAE